MGLFDRFKGAKVADKNPIAIVERDASDLIVQGNALEDADRFSQALQRYDAAIALAPQLARAHLNRGNVLLASDDAAAPITAFETAL